MTRMTTATARTRLADIVNTVAYGRERVVLTRHGKDIAALVPVEDLELLERIEDRMDLEAAREALKELGSRPWAEVKRELEL